MRKIIFICLTLLLCGLRAPAESFKLLDGKSVTGEILLGSANDNGLQFRVNDSQYERVPWSNFSQDDLKKFQANPKLAPMVEPFIEVSQEEKLRKTEVKINPVPRLERPPAGSLIGAMFSSGLGIAILLLLYAANLYAGYEVAVFRARPPAVVCGVAAILPVVGPIIFLSLPTVMEATRAEIATIDPYVEPPVTAATPAPSATHHEPVAPSALHVSHAAPAAPAAAAGAGLPATQTFQRGAFTFNRRFLETKFAGFFGVVPREAEKDLVLIVKAARGEYRSTRISRISANDLHLQVVKGPASEEVLIPFTEIKEIQIKHKDAP